MDVIHVEHMGREVDVRVEHEDDVEDPFDDEYMCNLLHWHPRYSFGNDQWSDYGIYHDGSPRDGLYAWHSYKRYKKGVTPPDIIEFERRLNGVGDIMDYMRKEHGAEVLPVYLFDHSGLSMSTGSAEFRAADSAGWDWGCVGIAFMTGERIKREISAYNRKRRGLFETRVETDDHPDGTRSYHTAYRHPRTGEWSRRFPYDAYTITASDRAKAREHIVSNIKTYDMYLQGDVWRASVVDPFPHMIDETEIDAGWIWGYGEVEQEAEELGKSYIEAVVEHERMRAATRIARRAGRYVRNAYACGVEDEKQGAINRMLERMATVTSTLLSRNQDAVRTIFLEATS